MEKKLIQLIKMTAYYSFLGLILQVFAAAVLFASPAEGQNFREIKVKMKAVNISFEQALKIIEQKTNLTFSYIKDELPLNEKVTINSEDESLYNILEEFAKDYGLVFSRVNNHIIIKKSYIEKTNKSDIIETGTIRGKVTDANTKEPLVGASVSLRSTTKGGNTDIKGQYEITDIKPGKYAVAVSYIGYSTTVKTIEITGDKTIDLNFTLGQSAVKLDEVTVTGSVTERSFRESANSVSVIQERDLDYRNLFKLQNIIQDLPGVLPSAQLMQGYQNSKVYWPLSINYNIRGLSPSSSAGSSPVKYILDGVELYDQTVSFNLDPNDIEKIEVSRGPMSSTLYGSGSAGGIIQIFSKKGHAGLKVNFRTLLVSQESKVQNSNPFNTEYSLGIRNSDGASYYSLSVDYEKQPVSRWKLNSGQDEIDWNVGGAIGTTISGIKTDLSYKYSKGIYGNYDYPVWYTIAKDEGWAHPERLLNYASASAFGNYIYTAETQTAALNVNQPITDNLYHKLSIGLSYKNYPFYSSSLDSYSTTYMRYDYYNSTRNAKYFIDWAPSLSDILKVDVIGGFDYNAQRADIISGSGYSKPAGDNSLLNSGTSAGYTNYSTNTTGLFTEAVWKFYDKLFVTTGYRTEKNDAYTGDGWYSMPRVGFSYVLEPGNDFAAKLRASWGKSTQALPISYKTGAVSGTILIEANPDLKPQTQYGYELGGDLFYTNNYSLGITYFDQTIDNYAYSITQPNFGSYTYVIQYQNVAKVFNKGVEASFKTILDPFTLDISATGVSSKYGPGNRTTQSSSTAYLAEGNKCIQVPSGSIYAKLSYNIPALLSWSKKGGSIGLDYRWSGSEVYRDYYSYYKTYAETGKYPTYVYKEQKGYSLVGLQFNYAVLNNLSVFLDVQNLLNNQNIVPGYLGILQGRTIGFGFNVTN